MADDGSGPEGVDPESLARAEAALARLSADYPSWLRTDLDRARACLTPPQDLGLLYTILHDVKGQAQTFGYPLITCLAQEVCRSLQYGLTDTAFILARLDMMNRILAQGLTGDGGEEGHFLLSGLD